MLETMKKIECFLLTIKYFAQGETWDEAKRYAKVIVYGFFK